MKEKPNKNQQALEEALRPEFGDLQVVRPSKEEMEEVKVLIATNAWKIKGGCFEISDDKWSITVGFMSGDHSCVIFNRETGTVGALSQDVSKVLYERAVKKNN